MRPTAEKVYGAVTGNAHDPTGNPSARCVVRVAPVPAAEKGVLEHFSRELGVAYDTEGEGEDETPVARIQTFESRLVAELNLVQQIDICRSLGSSAHVRIWRGRGSGMARRNVRPSGDACRHTVPTE